MSDPEEQKPVGSTSIVDTGTNPGENSDVIPPPPTISGPSQDVPSDKPKPQRVRPTNISVTNEISYFYMLFNNTTDLSESFDTKLLQDFGFDNNEIKQITFLLSAAIKANVDPKIVNFSGIGTNKILAINKLQRFIKSGRLQKDCSTCGIR